MTLQCLLPSVVGIDVEVARGLYLMEAFHWAAAGRRGFSDLFTAAVPGTWPCMIHAGCYSGALHNLKAVALLGPAAARADGGATVTAMKRLPTDEDLLGRGRIREDGRNIHDVHLFSSKAPGAVRDSWDICNLMRTTPGKQAFRPMGEGGCPLVQAR